MQLLSSLTLIVKKTSTAIEKTNETTISVGFIISPPYKSNKHYPTSLKN